MKSKIKNFLIKFDEEIFILENIRFYAEEEKMILNLQNNWLTLEIFM